MADSEYPRPADRSGSPLVQFLALLAARTITLTSHPMLFFNLLAVGTLGLIVVDVPMGRRILRTVSVKRGYLHHDGPLLIDPRADHAPLVNNGQGRLR